MRRMNRVRPGGDLRLLTGLALLALSLGISGRTLAGQQRTYATPEKALAALIEAAEDFDLTGLKEILGPDGVDLVVSEDKVQDRKNAAEFAAEARRQIRIVRDSSDPKVAHVLVGPDEWPAPIPIIEEGGVWRFDSKAGREEILLRRIGSNELDAIKVCRGYVEAQHEYASEKRGGAKVNQYAQHIVSTPGKQDGLAWQEADGTWAGPVGEAIARVIGEGYGERCAPFHGYYFKILKGQGPAAPMGEMDFLVNGLMIGGFAMIASPAQYGVTGVMSFIVSHNGIVYQKDLGPGTVDQFHSMERYNPDPSWRAVDEQAETDASGG
jgi:hypothetical protein